MTDNQSDSHARFSLLRELALSASHGRRLDQTLQSAIQTAANLAGLSAASVLLWNDSMQPTYAAATAKTQAAADRLRQLEEQLFLQLRRDRAVLSAYISFGGTDPVHSFTLPLRHGSQVLGAVIGLQPADQRPLDEHQFLEALAASISLFAIVDQLSRSEGLTESRAERERLGAIMETAVTVNHEINNPLTAILGNVQLLLLKRNDLDAELESKLRVIESAAFKIRDVAQRLLQVKSSRSTPYAEGTSMLDLSGTEPPDSPTS